MSIATRTPHWTITFEDDFEGPVGAEPTLSRWARDLGGGGFGNHELQSYSGGSANAFLDGDSHLVIEARKEEITGADGIRRSYSSARLKTQGRFSQTYGKFEARMKLPRGQGVWPAFWLLSDAIDDLGWPDCGEIDILESVGPIAKTVQGALHGPGYCGGEPLIAMLQVAQPLSDAFHTYAVEWEADQLRWLFDGTCYGTVNRQDVGGKPWPFDGPFFMLLNLAIGGDWPGSPDSTTTFPQRLLVDYVRVWSCGHEPH